MQHRLQRYELKPMLLFFEPPKGVLQLMLTLILPFYIKIENIFRLAL